MTNVMKKWIFDPERFDGSCLTVMSDGMHCDYSGRTLDELRQRYGNPHCRRSGVPNSRKRLQTTSGSFNVPSRRSPARSTSGCWTSCRRPAPFGTGFSSAKPAMRRSIRSILPVTINTTMDYGISYIPMPRFMPRSTVFSAVCKSVFYPALRADPKPLKL